ncbi:MAG TPA: phospholipid carrier-dependent glycosyltransferase [Chloroflexia bacterium]|nr:phospholipid carrier-dependent glycosyltransferase [Chloroflexia bacterium]
MLGLATLTIVLQAGLVTKLLRSLAGWTAGAWPPQAGETTPFAPGLPVDQTLQDAYSLLSLGQPLLPWILWAAAAIALVAGGVLRGEAPLSARHSSRGRRRLAAAATVGALIAITAIAAVARAANLLPDAAGTWPASNFDEQVYYTNARLLAQGEIPYRDHFLAHPPGAPLLLAVGQLGQAQWGGPGAFGAARQWLVIFSLLAIPLVFLIGRRLAGAGCGLLAAALLAVDGRVAQVAVLETLVNLWSLAAVLLYLYIPRQLPRAQRALWIILCGMCCAAAMLTKIPGLAVALILPLHALLLRRPAVAAGLVAATCGTGLAVLAPFLLVAPDSLLRQTLAFQLLRPQEVRPGIDEAARIAAYPTSLLTTTLAPVGLALLAAAIMVAGLHASRGRQLDRLLLVPLWAVPVLAVFTLGRSYHAPYYVQWAPPLALLGGMLAAPELWHAVSQVGRQAPAAPAGNSAARLQVPRARVARNMMFGVLATLALLPLFASAWQATMAVAPDTVYRPAGATVRDLSAATDAVLSFDPGYAYVAGRRLAVLPGAGRLVDSAGVMTYYGLGIDHRAWSDLLDQVLQFNKERNARAVFESTSAQASVLGGFWAARVAVVDGKIGLPQLRGQTLGLLGQMAVLRQDVEHVALYGLNPAAPSGFDFGPLRLRALTFEPLAADGSGTGTILLRQDAETEPLSLAPGAVLQIGCYWQAVPATGDARVRIQLATLDGRALVDLDQAPDEERAATSTWNPAFVYPDLHNLQVPAGLPPGFYQLLLGVSTSTSPAKLVRVPVEVEVTAP